MWKRCIQEMSCAKYFDLMIYAQTSNDALFLSSNWTALGIGVVLDSRPASHRV